MTLYIPYFTDHCSPVHFIVVKAKIVNLETPWCKLNLLCKKTDPAKNPEKTETIMQQGNTVGDSLGQINCLFRIKNARFSNSLKADFQSSHEAPRSSLRKLADVLRVFCRSQEIVQNFELFFTRCERSQ
jgi:hypothetical protein